MISAISSAAGTSALRVLQAASRDIEATQTRISTGLRVNSAKDDPTLWSVGHNLKNDITGHRSVRDNLALVVSRATIATAGAEQVQDILGQIRNHLVSAASADDAGKTAIQSQVSTLQAQLRSAVSQASFRGENWLDGSTSSVSAVTSQTASGVQSTSFSLAAAAFTSSNASGILDKEGAASSSAVLDFDVTTGTIASMITDLDTAIAATSTAAGSIAGIARSGESNASFLSTLIDIKEKAHASLLGADLAEETSKLSALQVREQLATQSLVMQNARQQNILRLFQQF